MLFLSLLVLLCCCCCCSSGQYSTQLVLSSFNDTDCEVLDQQIPFHEDECFGDLWEQFKGILFLRVINRVTVAEKLEKFFTFSRFSIGQRLILHRTFFP